MKKISAIIILAMLFSLLAAFNVSAVAPEWTYDCAKLVLPVSIDAKLDGGDWEDAVAFVANNDSDIFQKYGFWQNTAADGIPTSTLSVTYKVKWDEQYLYIREERFDTAFSIIADGGPWPWEHSGTLFFLYYDKDGEALANGSGDMATWDYVYEPFWSGTILSGRGPGKAQFSPENDEADWADFTAGWKTAQNAYDSMYIFEIAIPWTTMASISQFPAPSEGLELRFTPVISAFQTKATESFGDNWNQLDFYVDTAAPDNPAGYGNMRLVGAIYTPPAPEPEPEPEPAEPDAPAVVDEPAPAPAPAPAPSPASGDTAAIFLAALLAAGAFVATKRLVRAK